METSLELYQIILMIVGGIVLIPLLLEFVFAIFALAMSMVGMLFSLVFYAIVFFCQIIGITAEVFGLIFHELILRGIVFALCKGNRGFYFQHENRLAINEWIKDKQLKRYDYYFWTPKIGQGRIGSGKKSYAILFRKKPHVLHAAIVTKGQLEK